MLSRLTKALYTTNINLDIMIAGKKIESPKIIAKGGTKIIIDIGDGYVIGVVIDEPAKVNYFIDAEINLINKFRLLGFQTQVYEKIIAQIEGETISVLRMKSFALLAQQGLQVRDAKNKHSSCGDSWLFRSLDNLKSTEHWEILLRQLAHDIYLYFINNLLLGYDSFNLVIEDTSQIDKLSIENTSHLFLDRGQKLRLYIYDINEYDRLYKEDKYNIIVDEDGNIFEEHIAYCISLLRELIINAILNTISTEEYQTITEGRSMDYFFLRTASKDPFETAWKRVTSEIAKSTITYFKSLSIDERKDKYLDLNRLNAWRERNAYFDKMQAERERLKNIEKQFSQAEKLREETPIKNLSDQVAVQIHNRPC